ncbi:MAG: electron transfer flavoprotein subunit beta/FixA family protein [Candidatus Heimdallarchaeota archaeon]|nr:electron transfer flavoprotein subunit beta/FixA family protein [Candidatus Heimdallarchaeota archaeon]MCK4954282.1 electron transfer flavoprotein subunit beta/FixA family protein [Candidatus Heimdallarchaeota archaeon]
MKIVVLVKQVPEADKVAVDPETGTLIREGVASILNPYCEYALDQAAKLKQTYLEEDIEIIAISMGPPQAKIALMRCLELGADSAYLLSDRKFAGSDVWATSSALKEGIVNLVPDFDLILTGKQAIDGDTAQVPAETAEQLGIPQITYGVDVKLDRRRIEVKREVETGYQILSTRLPALVTMSKGSNIRRIPSMRQVLDARKKLLETASADDLNIDDSKIGLKASPTQVDKIFAPPIKTGGDIIDGSDPVLAAKKLLDYLVENNFLKR